MNLNAYLVQTRRLRLRPMDVADDEFVFQLLNEPSSIQSIGDRNIRSLVDAQDYIKVVGSNSYQENGFGMYIVETLKGRVGVGICGLVKRDGQQDVELGYELSSDFRRQGFALEATTAVLRYACERLKLPQIISTTNSDNHPSIRLLEKLGFSLDMSAAIAGEEGRFVVYATAPTRVL